MKVKFTAEGRKVFIQKDGGEKEEFCEMYRGLMAPDSAAKDVATALNKTYS